MPMRMSTGLIWLVSMVTLITGCNQVHTSNGRTIEHKTDAEGLTTYPGRWELPQYLNPPPNDITLSHYFKKWLSDRYGFERYTVEPANEAVPIKRNLSQSAYLDRQMSEKAILSYLYYDDGEIIYDALAPQDRFSFPLNKETEFRSQSMGKSIVSYLVGHAICEGYINGVTASLGEWPTLDDTLYAEQTLIDVLNMRARDQEVVTEDAGLLKSGRWFNTISVKNISQKELKGTSPSSTTKYNYNGLATNIAMSYMIYKTDQDWQNFLDKTFQEKIGIEHRFFFMKNRGVSEEDGLGWYSAYATRYDYLRIGIAMLNDWKSNTCVGRYLKSMYEGRKPKNHGFNAPDRMSDVAKSYGGQFHMDLAGMKDRVLFGINGYGGQNILIDMENSRIVVTNAAHTNYDWRELVYNVIKNGELKN